MSRKVFGEFSIVGDVRIEKFVRELKSCESKDIYESVADIFQETGAFKCSVYFAEFICGRINGKYCEVEIPNTREWRPGHFFYGLKIYTFDEVKEEVKNSLPILADYLKVSMQKSGCTLAVKLRSTMFEPFSEKDDILIEVS